MMKSKLFWHVVVAFICLAIAVGVAFVGMPTPLPGVVAGVLYGIGSIIIFSHNRQAPDLVMHESCWYDDGKNES